jgi:pimeloyl-ACP methyl ester carboxylesterase
MKFLAVLPSAVLMSSPASPLAVFMGAYNAYTYPDEVAGMVIVDHAFTDPDSTGGTTSTPGVRGALSASDVDTPPVLISQSPISLGIEDDQNFQRLPQRNRDLHMWALSRGPARPTGDTAAECNEVVDGVTPAQPYPLGMKPLVVISTHNGSPAYQKLQTKLLALSRDSKQVVAEHSTHMVIVDAPETIVAAIGEVVTAIRTHGVLRK